jgi:hypothetical protein
VLRKREKPLYPESLSGAADSSAVRVTCSCAFCVRICAFELVKQVYRLPAGTIKVSKSRDASAVLEKKKMGPAASVFEIWY